ncbi:MAG: PBP1A family penicillin-binding protein [Acidobacteriota bacterium]
MARASARPRPRRRRGRFRLPTARWARLALGGAAALAVVIVGVLGFYYVQFSRLIDARVTGERDRVIPRVFARPLTLHAGQGLSESDLIARLNDLGYTDRSVIERPGEFARDRHQILIVPRGGNHAGAQVRVVFPEPRPAKAGRPTPAPHSRIVRVEANNRPVTGVTLDAPLLTGLATGSREKRRRVALASIPTHVQQAVLAIEDRRFYVHPGIDPISVVGAIATNLRADRRYPVGRSTITQQLARMFFLSAEFNAELQSGQRSYRRKVMEAFMAVVLETRATKAEILELYLNDIYLGNRGSFALHGVAEAARIYFGKDVSNLTLPEAALIAGVIQNPSLHSPFVNTSRAKARRDDVLAAMAETEFISPEAAARAAAQPVAVAARAVDNEAPYFVDYVSEQLRTLVPGITQREGALDVFTTLDLNLQRYAQSAVAEGLTRVDQILAKRRRRAGPAQAALVALDPKTGDVLAMVGGRFYNQSQFNRATAGRRQPGSTFKPFVYLAAFERAADEGRADLTPATMVWDEPTTWTYDEQEWSPRNYEDEYDGFIPLRRALALSRNIATIKVAEQVGFDQVATLWRKLKVGTSVLRGYPSVALGVFELTPLELATAYTLFPNSGSLKPPRALVRVQARETVVTPASEPGPSVARDSTTFLVTNMMRSVLNEGTGAGARAAGFSFDAAGKTGTTNDLRDAWFVGFTPDLLAVVWVGFDDNTPLGLSGTQAALPIWTEFMKRALAGQPSGGFEAPPGVSFVAVDRDTGRLALPTCPRVTEEAFLAGTEPLEFCDLHRW